jgi:predicted CXXCH cytochrome family protein
MPLSSVGLVLLVGMIGAACTDEETVFVERPFFDDPPANAAGFLGYDEIDQSLTICGNCHVGKQGDWEFTKHADAWNTLQESGSAQEFCENCHTVGPNGNATDDGGWASTADERYYDVQCESCHGPGETHVSNPDASAKPLASIAVGLGLSNGCVECHSGSHHPFVDEWEQSRHGAAANVGVRSRESCQPCHEGRTALKVFGEDAVYLEENSGEELGIVCAVCHDPHGGPNEHQLRFPVNVRNVDEHLCMKCHQRRAVPSPTSSRGPHSPQGPLLLGQDVGWIPPNFAHDPGSIVGTHGTEANPNLCATCHVFGREVTDPLSGDFVFSATGHNFKPIPCLDAQGVPTASEDCDVSERSFLSCTASGCHGTETAARSAFVVAKDRIALRVAELDALLALVPASEFDTGDNVLTVAEGAKFNSGLGAIRSSSTHNPFLTEALLIGSIQAVEDEYGVSTSVVRDWDAELQAVLDRVPR